MRLVAEIGAPLPDEAIRYAEALKGIAAVKWQMYRPESLVTRDAPTYGHHSLAEPITQWDAFKGAPRYTEWEPVVEACRSLGVEWFASVFDHDAIDWCEAHDATRYKIASADITYDLLLKHVGETKKPVILSTGASTLDEVARAMEWIGHDDITLMACTLQYPAPYLEANLWRMDALRDRFGGEVGYSDHTREVGTVVHAWVWGADLVEKHVTLTPKAGGDHNFAVTPDELAQAMRWWATNKQFKRDSRCYGVPGEFGPTRGERKARQSARRGIYLARNVAEGEHIGLEDLAFLRPCVGREPWEWPEVIGPASRDYRAGDAV